MASFHCYINRLLNIPLSTENYKKEINILKQLAYNSGYDPNLIHTLIKKTKIKKLKKQIYPKPEINTQKYISIPFVHHSLNKNLTKTFKFFLDNVTISYKNSLSSHLVNSKD